MEDERQKITIFDRILRELDLIENIYKAQFQVYPKDKLFFIQYPSIQNEKGQSGRGIDGKYICHIDCWSDVELFNLHSFKADFTNRFENTNDPTLIKNQLLTLHKKATEVRDFYNNNLTNKNKIVIDYLKINDLPFSEQKEKMEQHSTTIIISDYYINAICFDNGGVNRWKKKDYEFRYFFDNGYLALICQNIIDFFFLFEKSIKKDESRSIIENKASKTETYSLKLNDNIDTESCYNVLKSYFIDFLYT